MKNYWVVKFQGTADIPRECEVCGRRHKTAAAAEKCNRRKNNFWGIAQVIRHEDGHLEEVSGNFVEN